MAFQAGAPLASVSSVMLDVKSAIFTFMFVFTLTAPAAEVEYISPERQHQLESLFNGAHFTGKDSQAIQAHEWICDMYGMRTKMQVQRGLKLYKWSNSGSADWHNTGAQLISEYKGGSTALVGQKDRFEDQVKMTQDGQLVSRLALNNSEKTVIAYSVCKTL